MLKDIPIPIPDIDKVFRLAMVGLGAIVLLALIALGGIAYLVINHVRIVF